MARPVWKGHIAFGLVNVPVVLFPAEQRTDLQLHMLDSRNNSRVQYERVNAETGQEVPWDQVVKGYEYSNGNYVILSDEELKRAAPEATRTVEIESFVDPKKVDPIFFDKPYYLAPGKGADKGYVLLRETLRATGLVGVARVVIRTRQYICLLSVLGDALALYVLRFAQEVRSTQDLNIPEGAAKKYGVTPQEMKIAAMLVESMKSDWKPEQYHDEYRRKLMNWIDKRVKAGQLAHPPELPELTEEEAPAPINFMELLKKSVEGKPRRGAAGPKDDEQDQPARTGSRRRGGQHTAAKKTGSHRLRKAG